MTGYSLTRRWFDWNFENSRKARPIHGVLYLWCVEKSNRLGWIPEFQLPSDEAAAACGAADRETILKALSDLQKWGFIQVTQQAKNRYTARWIRILDPELMLKGNLEIALALQPKKPDAKNIDAEKTGRYSDAIPDATNGAIPTNNKQEKQLQTIKNNPLTPLGEFLVEKTSLNNKEKDKIPPVPASPLYDWSIVPEVLMPAVKLWIEYKKERKERKYGPTAFKTMVSKLNELSKGNKEEAIKVVEQSIANNWSGLFVWRSQQRIVNVAKYDNKQTDWEKEENEFNKKVKDENFSRNNTVRKPVVQ